MAVNKTTEQIEFQGIDKLSPASKSATNSINQMKEALGSVQGALGAIGVSVGAGAFIKLQLDALHAVAALDDMAEQTGVSVEKLSALQNVAKVGGIEFDGFVSQIGRAVKGLKEQSEEGTKSQSALKFLGVNAKDASGHWRDFGDVVVDVSKKLDKYQDGAGKVALIQDVLGKGAERYLPLLKDIAHGTDLVTKVTAEQAARAEEAEKALNRLKIAAEDTRKTMVIGFTPAITNAAESLNLLISRGTTWIELVKLYNAASPFRGGTPFAAFSDRIREINEELGKLDSQRRAAQEQEKQGGVYEQRAKDTEQRIDRKIAELKRERKLYEVFQEKTFQDDAPGGAMDMGVGMAGVFDKPALDFQSPDLAAIKRRHDELLLIQRQVREADDKRELDQVAVQNKLREDATRSGEESIIIINDAANARAEDSQRAKADRIKLLREQEYGDAEARENEFYEGRRGQLSVFTDDELKFYGGRAAIIEQMEADHQDRVANIRLEALNRGRTVLAAGYRAQTVTVLDEIVRMTSGVAQHSRILFEINKVATVATIALKTPEAIASAYAFGAKFGGPPLGVAMGILAGAAMAVQAKAAAAATYQGGGAGSAPSVSGTTPAPAVTPVAAPDSGAGGRTSITIKLVGEEQNFSTKQVRALLEQLADLTEGGARVFVG
jgi:hypothetical protein